MDDLLRPDFERLFIAAADALVKLHVFVVDRLVADTEIGRRDLSSHFTGLGHLHTIDLDPRIARPHRGRGHRRRAGKDDGSH